MKVPMTLAAAAPAALGTAGALALGGNGSDDGRG